MQLNKKVKVNRTSLTSNQEEGAEQKIIAAARRIFQRKGMAGARMEEIATVAGINKALLHYYFRSKEKLFQVIMMEAKVQMFDRLHPILGSDDPLFVKIEKFAESYISFVTENPFLPGFILHEINRHPEKLVNEISSGAKQPNLSRFFQQVISEIKKKNIVTIQPEQLFMNMLSMCVFPFVGRPMLQVVMNVSDKKFRELLEERKKQIPIFIINSIKR
jgi:TetR/AcrR family transcriptional regulator